ncbi:T9SS type A sorting domain-containing protein [Flavobacterium orientale]|uniref:Secretion system C-terminal sorting domain-containing protein n=1 Tax=Flavobacterium orientale TaxID=1756020 RepID=A0A917D9G4_9FLAO|nr:T9SS type A sorting domain-containing protein [Flavobacterium orientale]GGD13244.1 hypothetical protein GCM10011343_00380 [Flavobacterium orientale]
MKKELLTLLMLNLCLFLSLNCQDSFSQNSSQEQFDQNELVAKVIPNAYESTAGALTFNGPLSNSQRTYQLLIASSQLTDLIDKELTSLSFRIPANSTGAWPTSQVDFSNYDIYLSQSVSPPNRSLTSFPSNVVGAQTLVRSGGLSIPAGAFPSGSNPNPFGFQIVFSTNWLYVGGDLLIEIRHTGYTGTSRSVEAIGTAVTGYGTLFSACWTGNYTGTSGSQGNFSVIELRGQDALSIGDLDQMLFSVFPNPANDMLNFQAEVPLKNVNIYNNVGQLVYSQNLRNTFESIMVSGLHSGVYIAQLDTDYGVKTLKFVKK